VKKISLLGSTGSIGCQTLEVVSRNPDKLKIAALAAGKGSLERFLNQIHQYEPEFVAVPDEESSAWLKARLKGYKGEISYGQPALAEAAVFSSATHLVVAVVGSLGLVPTLEGIAHGKIVALANKETLVAGGHLVDEALKKYQGTLIPIDSEHSAIFQCLKGEERKNIRQIWLTASGGPFRGYTKEKLKTVTKDQVLNHPIWKMGSKITVDSASLMNKGLEVIEAKWLFGVSPDQIRVVVHPQGIVHSMVEFCDGSIIAQLGAPDMRTPIQIALSYPDRWGSPSPGLDITKSSSLTFEDPDFEVFPCLKYAFEAAQVGGTLPAVLNAANEAAVQFFLEERISFFEIPKLVRAAMKEHPVQSFPNLEQVLEVDQWGREFVKSELVHESA
jgi:1-deoxy-D-xylulose-5-phosphate reductoisomerase